MIANGIEADGQARADVHRLRWALFGPHR
jgi:hypothetical protein